MKERWIALGLAVASLLMFYALLIPKSTTATSNSLPLSTETGPNGLAAAWRWLSAESIPVVSLRERYDHLAPVAASGNVLITSIPGRLAIRADEQAALERWIESGNTLVVLAALDDTPAWSVGHDLNLQTLARLIHITFNTQTNTAAPLTDVLANSPVRLEAIGRHALLSGVREIRVVSELPASHWRGQPREDATLAIARRADDNDAAFWLKPLGAGQILVSALAGPFSNAQISQADNARLLANIVAWSRAPTGQVLFDDAHQGLVSFYDPRAFFADPRLHRSIGWILLLWIVWVLGAQTMRAPAPVWSPLDESALIDASGRFFSRHVSAATAARALLENFFNRLHRRLRQTEDGTPMWDWLELQPRVTDEQLRRLQRYWQRAVAGRKVDLMQLQNLLADVRGRIDEQRS